MSTYRVTSAVLSNEELWASPGGEPIVWVVMQDPDPDDPSVLEALLQGPDPIAVFFDEQSAHEWLNGRFCTSDDPTNHQGDTCPVHEVPSPEELGGGPGCIVEQDDDGNYGLVC